MLVLASIWIDPPTHSSSDPQAPNLNITIISHHPEPITFYADNLDPKLMLQCGAFIITELSTGMEVKQCCRAYCRIPPPSKAEVPLNEHLFRTLLPNTPLTLSTPFTPNRTNTGGVPLAKDDTQYANDRSASHGACGVDGLEPGHKYVLSLASKPRIFCNSIRWWEYGMKEQILQLNEDGKGLDARRVRFDSGPHEPIQIDTGGIGYAHFDCTE